jgi:hypothetical protein
VHPLSCARSSTGNVPEIKRKGHFSTFYGDQCITDIANVLTWVLVIVLNLFEQVTNFLCVSILSQDTHLLVSNPLENVLFNNRNSFIIPCFRSATLAEHL